jgi:predicted metal-dependent peptidase
MLPKELERAKNSLLLRNPFFGVLLLGMKFKEDNSPDTIMWTDSVYIGYNPERLKNYSGKEIVAILVHEIMHIVLLHMTRRKNRDPVRWNIACDYAVNYLICRDVTLPDDALIEYKYNNKSAEEIYDLLPEQLTFQGGALIGEVRDYIFSPDDKDYRKTIDVKESEWKGKMSTALQLSRMQGKGIGGAERAVTGVLEPKVSWKELLSSYVNEHVRNDYNWESPCRNFLHLGIYLPSLDSPELSNIVVIVDTSGSIGQKELDQFASEIRSMMQTYPSLTITVIYVDTKVANVEELRSGDFELHPSGGGGTDFRPGFEYIEKEGLEPTCVIYLTDGYSSSYPEDPDVDTLWVIYNNEDFYQPFGQKITISGD